MTDAALLETGRRVLRLEAEQVAAAADRLDGAFVRAARLIADAPGRVIVSGVGKSGLIGRKLAATLTSTGTPASYIHPVDSLHGDLGIVGRDDVAIVLSKSGESQDLFGLVSSLERLGVPIIAITGRLDSLLARVAAVALDASVSEEACPHDLAPTASTSVALALGDALAVALLELKGFRREDFAAIHPGGSIGRRLLLRVRDVMVPPDAALDVGSAVRDAVLVLARCRGIAMITERDRLVGVLTAGDLTRLAGREDHFLDAGVRDVMTRDPRTTDPDELGAAAVGTMERFGIMVLPVVAAERVVGAVHLHDLLRAGAV